MSPTRLLILRIATPVGAAISAYLIWQHIAFVAGNEAALQACQIFGVFDCSLVEQSAFSEVLGIPTGSFGLLYFLLFGSFVWFARPGDPESPAASRFVPVATLLAGVGLAASIVLALISALIIRGFCLWCMSVYFVTLINAAAVTKGAITETLADAISGIPAMFAGLKGLFLSGAEGRPSNRTRMAAVALVIAAGPINFALAAFFLDRAHEQARIVAETPIELTEEERKEILDDYWRQPVVELEVGKRALTQGRADAPLQIVVFTDFECPYCQKFDPSLKDILARTSAPYRLVYKHFPLSRQCNPLMRAPTNTLEHPRACRLADLSQVLGEMGKFWEAGSELYKMKGKPLNEGIKEIAERSGIDYREWIGRLNHPAIRGQVTKDILEGIELRLSSVPTVFVNGRMTVSIKPEAVEAIIQAVAENPTPPEQTPDAPETSATESPENETALEGRD